ncbi:MAG: outer membrane protein assembly factor BamD [Gammaproteobacteria bacterium]|nr:outer membrane protein assembly factor BamD [Gammaproteobacteria bacterium]
MKRLRLYLVVMLLAGGLSACKTTPTSPIEKYHGQSADKLFHDGTHDMLHHNYKGASDRFEALNALYPLNHYAEQTQLNSIYAYFKEGGNLAMALAASDRYIQLYPRSKHIDYAYYMRGVIEMHENSGVFEHFLPSDAAGRDLNERVRAFRDFDMVIKLYPHSPYAADAVQRMLYIRNVLAEHRVEIAQYYYQKRAFVAAINRANEVVLTFQGTPAVPEALVIMVKSYRRLQLPHQTNQAMQLLQHNYPNSKYIKQARKFK